jgi:hypothetical protein
LASFRDKKVVGVFVRFRARLVVSTQPVSNPFYITTDQTQVCKGSLFYIVEKLLLNKVSLNTLIE